MKTIVMALLINIFANPLFSPDIWGWRVVIEYRIPKSDGYFYDFKDAICIKIGDGMYPLSYTPVLKIMFG